MNNQLNKIISSKFRFSKLLFGSLLIGLPLFTTLEAQANMHQESMPNTENNGMETMPSTDNGMETMPNTENNDMESENLEASESREGEAVATINPTEGTVDVLLKNNTNAAIDYQAIGYTENQTLKGGEEHTLRNLPVPVVIRSARQDDGFIKVLPINNTNEAGKLEVTLNEDPEFYDDNNVGVLRIEEDGQVYVN
jgi:hypothetical protein